MKRRCRRRGHDFFPGSLQRSNEFLPALQICLRCNARNVDLPWGQCMSGHPLAEHYDPEGNVVVLAGCAGPA